MMAARQPLVYRNRHFFSIDLIEFCVCRHIAADISVILNLSVTAVDVQQNTSDSTEIKQNTCPLKDSSVLASTPPAWRNSLYTPASHSLTSFTVQSIDPPPHAHTHRRGSKEAYGMSGGCECVVTEFPCVFRDGSKGSSEQCDWGLLSDLIQYWQTRREIFFPNLPQTSFHFKAEIQDNLLNNHRIRLHCQTTFYKKINYI